METASWLQRRSQKELQRHQDERTPSARDMARIIHSAAFRRLQAKTQVLGIGEGDFHRTRLTHSMEVAQIGKGIVQNIRSLQSAEDHILEILPDNDLMFAVGLAHDLGHPPFGHGGEIALNYCMREHGGFEGNGQTLRILSKIEHHTRGHGLDLTRRTLLGILKYPVQYSRLCKTRRPETANSTIIKSSDWKPPKCYHDDESDVVNWLLEPLTESDRKLFIRHSAPKTDKHGKATEKSLDTSILELADDIAYGVHDLEDGIALGLITKDKWVSILEKIDQGWIEEMGLKGLDTELFGEQYERKQAIGGLVNAFMTSISIKEKQDYSEPLLRYGAVLDEKTKNILSTIKGFVMDNVVKIPQVQTLEFRGQHLVLQIFEAIASDPKRFLSDDFSLRLNSQTSITGEYRIICDYIAGMTDEYATRMYERLFLPRQGTIFQKL